MELTRKGRTTVERVVELAMRLGGGIVLQRVETDDGFDLDLTQAESTARGSFLQGLGLHPAPLANPMQSEMFSAEQGGSCEP